MVLPPDQIQPQPTPDAPFCYYCGYSLVGLELLHNCPECGHLADPEAQNTEANAFVANFWSWFCWLRRPKRLPAALWYAQYDPQLIRTIRRRSFFLIWLPALCTLLLVGFAFCLVKESKVRVTYYLNGDPQHRPLWAHYETKETLIYGFGLNFDGLFDLTPPGFATKRECVESHLSLRWRTLESSLPLIGLPVMSLVVGFVVCRAIAAAGFNKRRRTGKWPGNKLARWMATSLLIPPMGVVLWIWFVGAATPGILELIDSREGIWSVLTYIEEASLHVALVDFALWVGVPLIGWLLILRTDRAGITFAHPRTTASLLGLWQAVSPVVFIYVLAQLF